MAALYEEQKVKQQTGIRKVQRKKGLLSSEVIEVDEPIYEETIERVPSGKFSDTHISMDDFARRIVEACNDLEEKGYDVVKITDVIGGSYNYAYQANGSRIDNHCSGGGYSYGYGYSVTDGAIIIAKQREQA